MLSVQDTVHQHFSPHCGWKVRLRGFTLNIRAIIKVYITLFRLSVHHLDSPGLLITLFVHYHEDFAKLLQSHINAETPGAIHEGGELGYALAVSFGAVMDNPDLIVPCIVGDGEAETGPTATFVFERPCVDEADCR